MQTFELQDVLTYKSIEFVKHVLERSGAGNSTACPPAIVKCPKGKKANRSVERSREESETIMCDEASKALKNQLLT